MRSALHQTPGEEDSSSTSLQNSVLFRSTFEIKILNIERTHLPAAMEIVVLRKYLLKQKLTKAKLIINIWLRKSAVNSGS